MNNQIGKYYPLGYLFSCSVDITERNTQKIEGEEKRTQCEMLELIYLS